MPIEKIVYFAGCALLCIAVIREVAINRRKIINYIKNNRISGWIVAIIIVLAIFALSFVIGVVYNILTKI